MTRTEAAVWRKYDEMESRLSAPLSERMLTLAGLRPGHRVVDVASGRGEPALGAARRVAPDGLVIATDRSDDVLEIARERARAEATPCIQLHVSDAHALTVVEDAWADAVLCRWGLMYFDDPLRALRAARRVLSPGGRLVVAVWADLDRVSYVSVPRKALSAYFPPAPLDLTRPGPLYYGAPARLDQDLRQAGFTPEHEEELDVPILEAPTESALVEWVLTFGQSAAVESLPADRRARWQSDLVDAATPYKLDGQFRLGGVTRIVVARPR